MGIFRFLGITAAIPDGFVDYDAATFARAFAVNIKIAKLAVREYHQLLNGSEYFASNIGNRDLATLSRAVTSHLGTTPVQSAAIARWFGRLEEVLEEQRRARSLGIIEKTWLAVCQYDSPGSNQGHAAYNGKKFNSQKGLQIDGAYLLPGAEIGCCCNSKSSIPGFDD